MCDAWCKRVPVVSSLYFVPVLMVLFALLFGGSALAQDEEGEPSGDEALIEEGELAGEEGELAGEEGELAGEAGEAMPEDGAEALGEEGEAMPEDGAEALPEDAGAGTETSAEALVAMYSALPREEIVALMQTKLAEQKARTLEKLEAQVLAKEEARMGTMMTVLFAVACCGVLLLGAPLVLRKRYPGKDGVLFKFGALAAATFFVAMLLFMVVLALLRTTQDVMASVTNPQMAIIESVFDNLQENADDLAEVAPLLILPPLAQMEAGAGDEDPTIAILNHAQAIQKDAEALQTLASSFGWLSSLMSAAQSMLVFVALGLFMLGIKDVLLEIIKMPARAAAGEVTGKDALRSVFRTIGAEFKATFVFMGGLIVVAFCTGVLLSMSIGPATEALLAYLLVSILYLMSDASASVGVVYVSVIGSMLFLVLNVAVVLVGSVFFLGKLQKIAKLRFHKGVPLRAHKRFFGRGFGALLWALLLPVIFVSAAEAVIDALSSSLGDDPSFALLLLSGPVILVVGFVVVFWAARGLKALLSIKRYDVTTATAAAPALPVAPAGAAA